VINTLGSIKEDENSLYTLYRLLLMWSLLATFTILTSIFISFWADKMAHRRRVKAINKFYEHALTNLPLN